MTWRAAPGTRGPRARSRSGASGTWIRCPGPGRCGEARGWVDGLSRLSIKDIGIELMNVNWFIVDSTVTSVTNWLIIVDSTVTSTVTVDWSF